MGKNTLQVAINTDSVFGNNYSEFTVVVIDIILKKSAIWNVSREKF